ncbi:MAG: hypothetical protein L0H79_15440 [Intrasporangium sp.]|uniref:hypothetical protein n=1 Tax=Intrasporangium sp. TaxID=1925024 RepID=UPI002648AD1F|nr:hypothetical protein [Intrasporangium sp.]MDN5797132.1 hypothetical protein [Intrasporangium sp.]
MHSPLDPHSPIAAWVDESGSNRALDPHTYILSAAICMAEDVEATRDQMRQLLLPGKPKVHWRDDEDQRHGKVTATIAECSCVEHLVVIRSAGAPSRSEHRRRKALELMLFQLTALDVGPVILESRGRKDGARDHGLLEHMRVKRHLLGSIRMDHSPGPADPML